MKSLIKAQFQGISVITDHSTPNIKASTGTENRNLVMNSLKEDFLVPRSPIRSRDFSHFNLAESL